ncbi:hypothetical protein [Rhodoferax koreensis]|uniref:hypothetical protein n=1 Tax=Rhodoferax koreensis TaxID=1842727 RepID=UPI0012FFB453|nr:hypothetical protein [Rhodoferax koreense]
MATASSRFAGLELRSIAACKVDIGSPPSFSFGAMAPYTAGETTLVERPAAPVTAGSGA